MNGWVALMALLPENVRRALCRLPQERQRQVQEIRLREGQAVSVGVRGREYYVTAEGAFTENAGGAVHCTATELAAVVDRACEHSLYAHQEELRHGFLPAPEGCRIGIAGTAVVSDGVITGYRQITSLCIRVAGEHRGCARSLAELLCRDGVQGALICGEPSCGKTSLLRDLLRELVEQRLTVAVVDERFELACGLPLSVDVLRGAPKAQGIEQAIRALSPQVIVFDELGSGELLAVNEALFCGVPIVATAHCRTPQELLQRKGMKELLRNGCFPYVVILSGRSAPGKVASVIVTEEWLNEITGNDAAGACSGRLRYIGGTATP